MSLPAFVSSSPPAHGSHILLSYPAENVLLLTLNRPEVLNAVNAELKNDIEKVMLWFESEPGLWAVIITGTGRAFCGGADLKRWKSSQDEYTRDEVEESARDHTGFAGLARRRMIKPCIAAVNGHAFGGGTEIVLNCDIVVAAQSAKFGLPEAHIGVVATGGGIPRLLRIAGHQRASELLLTAKHITSTEAYERFGFVNEVVPNDQVLSRAIEIAKLIASNSPDAILSTKRGILEAHGDGNVDLASWRHIFSEENKRVYTGENIKEGLLSFAERRKPIWKNPKL